MNFYGDVNLPFFNTTDTQLPDEIKSANNVFNFESVLTKDEAAVTSGIALCSQLDAVRDFKESGFSFANLANNHITDYNDSINKTVQSLNRLGIKTFGAGINCDSASEYIKVIESGITYCIVGFGWDVIGCNYATKSKNGVNPYSPDHVKNTIEAIKAKENKAFIVCNFHYNYEFEIYPQPADRKLFYELIDLGVDCIIGHHSHLVGPYEKYKNKYIFYSLGNFFMPVIVTRGYQLKYTSVAYRGIGVELGTEKPLIHFFETVNDFIKYDGSSPIDDSDLVDLKILVGDEDYIDWFKANRKKRKLLPIFKNYDDKFDTFTKSVFVKLRNKMINIAVRLNLKR